MSWLVLSPLHPLSLWNTFTPSDHSCVEKRLEIIQWGNLPTDQTRLMGDMPQTHTHTHSPMDHMHQPATAKQPQPHNAHG